MRELILDITYNCNSNCNYCQWSASNSKLKRDLPIKHLLISKESLINLDVSRIVITGGEPTISNNLKPILKFYQDLNFPIRMISNGIELNKNMIFDLIAQGVKEFIISIDSFSYDIYSLNRKISQDSFQKIIENLTSLSNKYDFKEIFIGLNVVLTSLNCNWKNISEILNIAEEKNFNQVKFQPVFDDGYLSYKAPNLILTHKNIKELEIIRNNFKDLDLTRSFTNPVGFWTDLISHLVGNNLNPLKCDVSNNAILLHDGILKFCFWSKHANYGSITENLTRDKVELIRRRFKENLYKCKVLPQCFCLQPIDHVWISRRS